MGMNRVVNEEDCTSTMSSQTILEMFQYSITTVFVKYHTFLRKNHSFTLNYDNFHFKVMKDALFETLHQFQTHPFYNGIKGRDSISNKIERWAVHNHISKQSVDAVACYVFKLGMNCSKFCLNVFPGVISDILFNSGSRKHQVSFHDWLLLLLSKVNISTVGLNPESRVFQGDLHRYTLSCVTCGVCFGQKTDLVTVLGGAASAIMDHFGFGLEWKELHSIASVDFDTFQTVFDNLGPLLFTSAQELLNHIERNGLHTDECAKIPVCKYATVDEDDDYHEKRWFYQKELENSFKMSGMCSLNETDDISVHECTNYLVHILFEYEMTAHDSYKASSDQQDHMKKTHYHDHTCFSSYDVTHMEIPSASVEHTNSSISDQNILIELWYRFGNLLNLRSQWTINTFISTSPLFKLSESCVINCDSLIDMLGTTLSDSVLQAMETACGESLGHPLCALG